VTIISTARKTTIKSIVVGFYANLLIKNRQNRNLGIWFRVFTQSRPCLAVDERLLAGLEEIECLSRGKPEPLSSALPRGSRSPDQQAALDTRKKPSQGDSTHRRHRRNPPGILDVVARRLGILLENRWLQLFQVVRG
jgi:hypothetical protein